jgi:6-phosphogluconolactonase (cycloisomerase 2 family)
MIEIVGPAYGAGQPTFVYAAASNTGQVFGYTVDSTTGALSPVPGSPVTAGLIPFAVALTPSNKFLYVTNYDSGTISAYTVNGTTGALTEVSGSPFAAREEARTVAIDPSGKFLYVGCDSSGTDLWAYTIDQTTGALTPVPGSPYYTAPISHEIDWNAEAVAVDHSSKFLYVATEETSVLTYQIDSNSGALTQVSSSNYGPGVQPSFMGVDPSGKFVYVTGIRDVFAYTTDTTTGELTPVSGSPFESGYPYEQTLAIDPLDRFVYTANSNPDGFSAYTIDRTTGALTPISGSPFTWATAPGFGAMAIDPSGKFLYVPAGGSSNGIAAYTIDGANGTLALISGAPFAVGTYPRALTITNAPSTTPFEKFEAKVYIDEDRKTSFRAEGFFRLGQTSDGIDPVSETVELQVGSFSATIPAGSFRGEGRHTFKFEERINDVDLKITIDQADRDDHEDRKDHDNRKDHDKDWDHHKGKDYLFTAEGKGDFPTKFVNPLTAGLTIGDNVGTTTVRADIDK